MLVRWLIFDLDDTLVSGWYWTPAETRLFELLFERFRPEVAAKIHAHSKRSTP